MDHPYRGDPDPSKNPNAPMELLVQRLEEYSLPAQTAGEVLGLCRQRVWQLGSEGKIRSAYSPMYGLRFYNKEDVIRLAQERGSLDAYLTSQD